MSTEIVAKFYFDNDHPAANDVFCVIARTFEQWPHARDKFHGLGVFREGPHLASERHRKALSASELCLLAAPHNDPDSLLSTSSSFSCWQFDPVQLPRMGSVGIWLRAWGHGWGLRNYEDHRVGGDGEIAVFNSSPFHAIAEEPDDRTQANINAGIRENLETLEGLLNRLIEALQPRSAKVFTNQGLYLPFNAHLAYYRDESAVIEDLRLIRDVWVRGLPAYNIAPLQSKRPDEMGSVFHHWRTSAERERLWSELDAALAANPHPSIEDVRRALNSGRFDSHRLPVGTTLLNLPYYLNSFLDQFYVDVLANSRSRGGLNGKDQR